MTHIDLSALSNSVPFCNWLGVDVGYSIDFRLLGHGEYNLNYVFNPPNSSAKADKMVLRIPMGSQMHLANQVRYEYDALKLLESSGRTPKPLYIDDSMTCIPYGFLVMGFLPGGALSYEMHLPNAAACLADIHNLEIPADTHLITPNNPLGAIFDECNEMFSHYLSCDFAPAQVKSLISALLEKGSGIISSSNSAAGQRCIINTEVNSGNFLVSDGECGKTYLVDWEKPLFASPGQDLGHFLAPTTTLWKTDTILSADEIMSFLEHYCKNSARYDSAYELREVTMPYLRMNCLRGITWCAMAWVEYQSPDRLLRDELTFEKIKYYLSPNFLKRIGEEYIRD